MKLVFISLAGFIILLQNNVFAADSVCKGISKSSCSGNSSCVWVGGYKKKDGAKVKGYCRLKGKAKAADKKASSGKSSTKKSTKKKSTEKKSENNKDKAKKSTTKKQANKKSSTKKSADKKSTKKAKKSNDKTN